MTKFIETDQYQHNNHRSINLHLMGSTNQLAKGFLAPLYTTDMAFLRLFVMAIKYNPIHNTMRGRIMFNKARGQFVLQAIEFLVKVM